MQAEEGSTAVRDDEAESIRAALIARQLRRIDRVLERQRAARIYRRRQAWVGGFIAGAAAVLVVEVVVRALT